MYRILVILLVFISGALCAQEGKLLNRILAEGSPLVQQVIANHEAYELQVIYSEIYRKQDGSVSLTPHELFIDDDAYFYPASTVKFPVALFAVEKINEINRSEITLETPIAFGAGAAPQYSVFGDHTARDSILTIGHLIKKVFLTSDNEAYNLLYAFVGQETINKKLQALDDRNNKITHRVGDGRYDLASNRYGNPFVFFKNGKILYSESQSYNDDTYEARQQANCRKGVGYVEDGVTVQAPFDFCNKNYLSLKTLHQIMSRFVYPALVDENDRFNITDKQREVLLSYMGARPRESKFPTYDSSYYDSYVKFFVVGDEEERMPEGLRIFNKVGYAYGYLTDVAYIVDLDSNIEFFVSATIHVNADGIYNDDAYEYDSIGIPFLSELGRLILEHERKKNNVVRLPLTNIRKLKYD